MKIGLNIGLPLPSSSTFLPSLYDLLRRIINQVNFLSDVQASVGEYGINFLGTSSKIIAVERNTTANTAGQDLLIASGTCTSGATDKNGGILILTAGASSGTGESGVQIKTAQAGATGTADRTPTTIIEALGNKLAFNGATPITKPTVTGSRGGNAALASLLTALATLGLITDSTTA